MRLNQQKTIVCVEIACVLALTACKSNGGAGSGASSTAPVSASTGETVAQIATKQSLSKVIALSASAIASGDPDPLAYVESYVDSVQGTRMNPPPTNRVSTKLTCGVAATVVPPASHQIAIQGDYAGVRAGFSSPLGGVGTMFQLVNPEQSAYPIDISESRSAAGAGWQFSDVGTILNSSNTFSSIAYNQSAGNSTGDQHGYDANLIVENTSQGQWVRSGAWTPHFSDSRVDNFTAVNAVASVRGPCPGYSTDYSSNGALNISMVPVQTKHGKVVSIRHQYSLNTFAQQDWLNWQDVNAFYISSSVAAAGNLRVYVGNRAAGWYTPNPLYPWKQDYATQRVTDQYGADHFIEYDNPNVLATLGKAFTGADYLVLVWNIKGQDIAMVTYNTTSLSIYNSRAVYCTDPTNLACGSLMVYTTGTPLTAPFSIPQGATNTYTTKYLIGSPEQMHGLGFHSMNIVPTQQFPSFYTYSNDVLNSFEWSEKNTMDGNPNTAYSSHSFKSNGNDRGTFVATWLTNGAQEVNELSLTARKYNGVIQAFPKSYQVYVTSPNNSSWLFVGTFSTQPNADGVAIVDLKGTYKTYGALLIPVELGTDSFGSYYFQMAEMRLGSFASNATRAPSKVYRTAGSQSNDILNMSAWSPGNVSDGNLSTSYSSNRFLTHRNDRAAFLYVYTGTAAQPTNQLLLTARANGAIVNAFPLSYKVYVANPTNTAWIFAGTFSAQPDAGGVARIQLGATYNTNNVMIVPDQLGSDSYGNFYFQMAEVNLAL